MPFLQKFLEFNLTDKRPKQVEPAQASGGSEDEGKMIALNSDGKVDITMMPDGVGGDTVVREASESLVANDLVNLWNDGGTLKVRKADATDMTKPANGFVKNAYSATNSATVYLDGVISGQSSLTPGTVMCLAKTAGASTDDITGYTGGNNAQTIGVAVSATEIAFEQGETYELV